MAEPKPDEERAKRPRWFVFDPRLSDDQITEVLTSVGYQPVKIDRDGRPVPIVHIIAGGESETIVRDMLDLWARDLPS